MSETLWQIARDGSNQFAGQQLAELRVRVASKEAPEVLAGFALGKVMSEQTLDRVGNFSRQAAISGGPRGRLMQAQRTSNAEVVGVEQAVVHFNLLALDPEVGDPVLAATVGAARDVQFEMLVESGEALIELLDQPTGESLGFGNSELAELGTAARDGAARKRGTTDFQSDVIHLFRERLGIKRGNVDHQQVLHVGGTEFAASKTFGEIRG